MRIRDLMFMLSSVALTAGCSELQQDAMRTQAAWTAHCQLKGLMQS